LFYSILVLHLHRCLKHKTSRRKTQDSFIKNPIHDNYLFS